MSLGGDTAVYVLGVVEKLAEAYHLCHQVFTAHAGLDFDVCTDPMCIEARSALRDLNHAT